ncbi:MAG: glutamate-5-semialdehyde dehydrogenase, partial [Ilumatobacteraceae bacterium]
MSDGEVPNATGRLTALVEGQLIPFGGDQFVKVSADLASQFIEGDRLVVVQNSGDLIRIEESVARLVDEAVSQAVTGFERLASTSSDVVDNFYDQFARLL